ncbi:SPOR domain-containing protein [Candidatus Pelagibacter sp.]|nr:SPOR domain-containing protein [Candidatus Pelagibacter sp.]
MNYKHILIIIFFTFLVGCEQHNPNKKINNQNISNKYKNSGFALIYNDVLKDKKIISKKINSRSLLIFHKSLKKNSFVKITNPKNQKTIIAEVISNKVIFSDFYNCVVTPRIAEELSLDPNEPYIDIILISQNSTFIAKKAKTFKEEKNVAEKAPVDGIKIDNLVSDDEKKNTVIKDESFEYSIKVADFYYKESAENMSNRIINETNIKSPIIKKISNTKYRVLLGPFDDIKKIQDTFNEIKSLNFENLEILKNV